MRDEGGIWSVGDSKESRIVVLPFYHLTEARTTTTAGNGGGDFVPFRSRSPHSARSGLS